MWLLLFIMFSVVNFLGVANKVSHKSSLSLSDPYNIIQFSHSALIPGIS